MQKEKLYPIIAEITKDDGATEKYAAQILDLLLEIDPERISPEYAAAYASGDPGGAIGHLAGYYRGRPDNTVSTLSAKGDFDARVADNASLGIMREVNIDWHFPDGKVDFLFDPTGLVGVVNHEWLWQLNRHRYWIEMARAYTASADLKYARAFRDQMLTWVASTEPPEKHNAPGSAWRTIESGIRLLGSWQVAFDGFRKAPVIEDVTLIIMIASMLKQTKHLIANPTKGNWLMMEMNGAYSFSALFPELRCAEENRRIATAHLLREMEGQILPDGMHNELSPDYQLVVINCATNFVNLARSVGLASEIPDSFTELIKRTADAAIRLMTPGFTQPRTNDTFTILTNRFAERAISVLGETPEYLYALTEGREGSAPSGESASDFLDYAGFVVMRSGYTPDASYLCFDVGPLGMGHEHQDKLNINLYKGNEELIYDDGGGQYDLSEVRRYAIGGLSHNLLTVDGMAENRYEPKLSTSAIDASFLTDKNRDYAKGDYADGFGKDRLMLARHTREIRFEKPDLFIVRDSVESLDGREHEYGLLFQLDTLSVKPFEAHSNALVSDYGRKYDVAIVPIEDQSDVYVTTESEMTEPYFAGWYNGRNESNLHPSTTVKRRVRSAKNFVFTTLLIPFETEKGLPEIEKIGSDQLRVTVGAKTYTVDLGRLDV